MAHTLLISSLHHPQLSRIGIQGLTETYRDSVSENGEKSFHKFCLHPVHGHILII